MKFNLEHHNAARALKLVQVVPRAFPEEVSDAWLDPDGIHLHMLWNITKAGAPDKRARAQSLLHRQILGEDQIHYAGVYVLATPENLDKLKRHQAKIEALQNALEQAKDDRDEDLALDGGAL